MRFCSFCRRLLAASFLILLPQARSQDASIDALLKKLPPPETFAAPSAEAALKQAGPAMQDPLAREIALAVQAQNFSHAADLAHQLLARFPKSAAAHFMNGSIAANLGRKGEASFSLRRAIKLQPDFAIAHFMLGNLEVAQRKYDAALPHLQKAVELEPKNPIALIFLSECEAKTGHIKEALDYAKRATVASPAFVESWFQLARVEKAVGHTDEALSALSRAAELAPDNAQLLATVGYSYLSENRFVEAIPLLRHAAEIEPNDALVQAQLGYCLLVTEQLDDAISYLKRATSLNPQYPEAWEHLASAYQNQGRHRDAIKAFKKANAGHSDLSSLLTTSHGEISGAWAKCGGRSCGCACAIAASDINRGDCQKEEGLTIRAQAKALFLLLFRRFP